MIIREFTKPITAKSLNETLAKKYGKKINLEGFTLQQLQDARNKLRTKLSQIEMNESFSSVLENDDYQKSKLMLDVLNAEISERGDIEEDAIEESVVTEGAEDQAEIVMAAKDMVDRVTNWMEDTAEMQTESMLELADAIRDEMGSERSEGFVQTVKPALEGLYSAMEVARTALTGGVGMLTGEGEMAAPMGEEPPMEPTVDMEAEAPVEDEFAAAEPAAGGEEAAGRETRESVDPRNLARKMSKKK